MACIRTIDKAFDRIAESDPGTALTRTALRRLVISGDVPSVRIGAKYLVDCDVLEKFLHGSSTVVVEESVPGIRRIDLDKGAMR